MRAIRIERFGGPEVLELAEVPDPVPTEGMLLLDVDSSGVNYADTHQAENSYLSATALPFVPGTEVVGHDPDGRRLLALVGNGGYAERALAVPSLAFEVPDGVDDGPALALLVQGLTAWHLLRTSTHLAPGETVVVHAAAGGVGTLAVQLAKGFGAGRVIGVASSAEKRALVEELGADATVDAASDDMKTALQDANDGRKVDVVLEMVGGSTFDASLAALAPFGRLAVFGMASRTPPTPIDAGSLMQKSRAVIGFWLVHLLGRPDLLAKPLDEMFAMVRSGQLRPIVGDTYPLADARRAHEALRSRRTTGKVILDAKQ